MTGDNPIADFAAKIERASRIGRLKLSLDQRGEPWEETDEYLFAHGYIYFKDVPK